MVVDALAVLYINEVCMAKNRARKHRPEIHTIILCIKTGENYFIVLAANDNASYKSHHLLYIYSLLSCISIASEAPHGFSFVT